MFNQDTRHKAADTLAAEQLISLNEAAARVWRRAGNEAETDEVKDLFLSTAKALEEAAAEIKKILPRVVE